jgi:hypothetical protein
MLTRKTWDRGKTRRHFFDFAHVMFIWSCLLPLPWALCACLSLSPYILNLTRLQ